MKGDHTNWETVAISALAALVISFITAFFNLKIQDRKLQYEGRTEFMAEAVILKLLQHPTWELRTFTEIERRIGGYQADELRRLLVRAGAVRFEKHDGTELWGLLTRNENRLA